MSKHAKRKKRRNFVRERRKLVKKFRKFTEHKDMKSFGSFLKQLIKTMNCLKILTFLRCFYRFMKLGLKFILLFSGNQ